MAAPVGRRPATEGDGDDEAAASRYGRDGASPALIVRCDRTTHQIAVLRSGLAAELSFMMSSGVERRAAGRMDEAAVPMTGVLLAANDELLDRMVFSRGRFAIVIPREGYFQIGYVARKGTDSRLRARGIGAFRRDVAELLPEYADRAGELVSMDDVKLLDVRLNRLRRWHVEGLLCIGDAAHAMSPVGGVGINLAVQDAVATATLLAGRLRRGAVRGADLARVRRRRLPSLLLVQALQRIMHADLAGPLVSGRPAGPAGWIMTAAQWLPGLRTVAVYLVGVGLRPERAPASARRGELSG